MNLWGKCECILVREVFEMDYFIERKGNSRNNSRKYWVSNSFYVHTQLVEIKRFQSNVGMQAWEEGRKFQLDCRNIMTFIGLSTRRQELYKNSGKRNLRQQSL